MNYFGEMPDLKCIWSQGVNVVITTACTWKWLSIKFPLKSWWLYQIHYTTNVFKRQSQNLGLCPFILVSPLNLGCGGVNKVGRGSAAPHIEILDLELSEQFILLWDLVQLRSRFSDPTPQECKFLYCKLLHFGFGPTLRKDLVASGKDLMTLRKDLMTVGKDRKTGFLREHLRVRDSHVYVRIGCVWKICDAFYGMLHSDELYLGWIYGV